VRSSILNLIKKKSDAAKERLIGNIVGIVTGLFFFFLLVFWFLSPASVTIIENVPGMDNRPPGLATITAGTVKIGEYFQNYSGKPSSLKGTWPRFRGKEATNISLEPFTISTNGGTLNFHLLWTVAVGEGHAAPVVANGRVYILDYDEARKSDALRCLSLDSGEEIWRRWYQVSLKRNHGISRSIPAVTDKYVVTMGPAGHVMCVNAVSGEFLWGIDTEKEYGSVIPDWYTAQCPLIDWSEAIIAPAGTSIMIGVDLATGRVDWKTPNELKLGLSHSSIIPMYLGGKRIFLYAAIGGLAGVSADKADRGRLLFVHKEWDNSVNAPSPVPFPDGRVFLTAGYGGGSMMMKITPSAQGYATTTLYRYRPKEGLACEQQTPILYKGMLYGIMPKDGGDFKNQFVCFNPDTGKIVWTTGKTHTFGLGPFIVADDKFFILSESGVLSALTAGTDGYTIIGQGEVIKKARDAWGPIAIAGQRLLIRDATRLFCIEL
jgi:outer membrane protein assembly factor BamB